MTILHIDSSIQGEQSASKKLSAAIVARLRNERADQSVEYRDLAAEPVPHLTLGAMGGPETNRELAQFLAADTVVIGAAMYNFAVASQLKAWIDRILTAGHTFRYGENGPEGMAHGKRVIVAITRGGLYGPGTPWAALEHAESYLNGVFGFMGITPEFVVAEGLKIDPDALGAALARVDALPLAA